MDALGSSVEQRHAMTQGGLGASPRRWRWCGRPRVLLRRSFC